MKNKNKKQSSIILIGLFFIGYLVINSTLLAVQSKTMGLGTVIGSFTSPGGTVPSGLEHDRRGNLYLTEADNDQVILMDTNGTVISSFSVTTYTTTAVGITTNGSQLYITDPQSSYTETISSYTLNGSYLFRFNIAQQSSFPEGITYNPHTHNLYIVDSDNNPPDTILEYTISGTLLNTYPLTTTSADGIAFDNLRCTYWLYDSGNDIIIHYSPVFTILETFPGSNLAGFGSGEGVAVIGNTLYLVAPETKSIVKFNLNKANKTFMPNCQNPTDVYLPLIINH